MTEADHLQAIISAVKASKKYSATNEETIRMLAQEAWQQHGKVKPAIKAVRRRLHSIMAPYLGDPDYDSALARLENAFAAADESRIKDVCWEVLGAHLSTRERLPDLARFYDAIFQVTGPPATLLDIACGLNPLAFPWMGLPTSVRYYAYDIHEPRVQFINAFFRLQGLAPLARLQDVALQVPSQTADVALFLKELPRFERNYRGRSRQLLAALPVRHLVVSFPTVSEHGGRNLTRRYRQFFSELIEGLPWSVVEILFDSELVFCVDTGHSPFAR